MKRPIHYKINIDKQKESAIEHFSLIVNLFKEIKIDYWIEYGTMLGAVREKGFIPWDSEFDVGIWNDDYVIYKEEILKKVGELGFYVNTSSKDRIKLLHKDLLIGAYTIDIHTYHLKGDTAFVSFNRRKATFYEKLYSLLKNFDNRQIRVYPISRMIKTILKSGHEIPREFIFTKLNYGNRFLYTIEFDNHIVKEKNPNYSLLSSLFKTSSKVLVSILPRKILYSFVDYLKKKNAPENTIHAKIQAIPSHFYLNLAPLPFENTYLNGPAEGVKYVENIYGKEWYIGKPDWVNSQNNINKNIDSVK